MLCGKSGHREGPEDHGRSLDSSAKGIWEALEGGPAGRVLRRVDASGTSVSYLAGRWGGPIWGARGGTYPPPVLVA